MVGLSEGIESHSPVSMHDEIYFSHVSLLFEQVSILRVIIKEARHEAKSYSVRETVVKLHSTPEEGLEGSLS